jgi:hypothetical protein
MKTPRQVLHSAPTALQVAVSLFLLSSSAIAQDAGLRLIPDQPPRNQLPSPKHTLSAGSGHASNQLFGRTAFSFLPSVQVNVDTGNNVNDFAPAIAVSRNGHIYVVWNGDETMKTIFFSRSTDGGKTFSAAARINDNVVYPPSYSVYQPDIALDSAGNIYVVWHDYRQWADDQSWTSPIDIFMDKSTDGGLTWNTDVQVSRGNGTYPWHFQPSIAIAGNTGNPYVSFTDYDRYYPQGDGGDVSVATSLDKGASFQSKVRVDDTPDALHAVQEFSAIALDAKTNTVFVAYHDSRNGSRDIYVAKSVDSARSFLPNILVNDDTTNDQEEPSVGVSSSGVVYVVWKDWRADLTPTEPPYQNDMIMARSTDGGNSFTSGVKINDTSLNAEYSYNFPPRLALDDSGNVHVTWFDQRFNYTNCFYDESVDGGLTFSVDAIVNDNRDSLSHSLPRIAVGNGRVYVVYMDKRHGNNFYDIFFTAKDRFTGVEKYASSIPRTFTLEQNYPNPFNPATTIRFTVPSPGTGPGFSAVTLRVYDILGNEIATLVDGDKPAGNYEIEFNLSSMNHPPSSGVYLYELRVGGIAQTRKMTYLK